METNQSSINFSKEKAFVFCENNGLTDFQMLLNSSEFL